MSDVAETIRVTEDGLRLPVIEILTGRGFVTGKSGSGKSNTASVVAEELLENGFPLMIVDTDGEYVGLQERYEMIHVGTDEKCDVEAIPEEAEYVVERALNENHPVLLDVSGIVDSDDVSDVVSAFVSALFAKEQEVRKPFLLVVEEMHEFVPEQGGLDDLGELLIRVAKRGRKRGLGVCGLSQRPAAVDKDFITQCDWIVWHRLTWKNDTAVVSSVLGSDAAETVSSLQVGEALLMTDWDEELRRVKFRPKRSADIGATPDLDRFEDESLTSARRAVESSEKSEGGESDAAAHDRSDHSPAPDREPPGTTVAAPETPLSDGEEPETSVPIGPPEPPDEENGDDEFDPVWELAHMVVYAVGFTKRAVWRFVVGLDKSLWRLWANFLDNSGKRRPLGRRPRGKGFLITFIVLLLAAVLALLLGVILGVL